VIDLSTGDDLWVPWPAIGIAMAFGLEMAPRLARGWLNTQLMRCLVVALGLLAINALTWSGYLWALWPIGGVTFVVLLGALSRRRPSATEAR